MRPTPASQWSGYFGDIARNSLSTAVVNDAANHAVAEDEMLFAQRAARVAWGQFKMQEQLVMLAMTAGPQRDVEWIIQRALCFHNVAEITPRGLKLTRYGRKVMAERHGLPVVVGREPVVNGDLGHLGRNVE